MEVKKKLTRERESVSGKLQEVRELKTKLREANTNSRYSAADLEAKKLAEQLEAEREKRVLHLQQVAARRITQIELAKGWQTWQELYLGHLRTKQLLKLSALTLMKPKLTAAYRVWYDNWEDEQRQQIKHGYQVLLAKRKEEQAEAEEALYMSRLDRRKVAQDSESALTAADQQARDLAAKLHHERERRVVHLQKVAAKRIGQIELAKGWQSWFDMWQWNRIKNWL